MHWVRPGAKSRRQLQLRGHADAGRQRRRWREQIQIRKRVGPSVDRPLPRAP
jgi:hypothetical protein